MNQMKDPNAFCCGIHTGTALLSGLSFDAVGTCPFQFSVEESGAASRVFAYPDIEWRSTLAGLFAFLRPRKTLGLYFFLGHVAKCFRNRDGVKKFKSF